MLREFQEEIARLKAELAAAGSGGSTLDSSSNSNNAGGVGHPTSVADAGPELSEEEVARMRQQLEDDLRAEYSSGGGAELDTATLEQVGAFMNMPAFPNLLGYVSAHFQMAPAGYFARAAFAVQLTIYCCVAMCIQIRQEVEVQLASQLRQVEAERQRAKREATKLGQQVQQQVAHK